jgi:hypothetical protein
MQLYLCPFFIIQLFGVENNLEGVPNGAVKIEGWNVVIFQ